MQARASKLLGVWLLTTSYLIQKLLSNFGSIRSRGVYNFMGMIWGIAVLHFSVISFGFCPFSAAMCIRKMSFDLH